MKLINYKKDKLHIKKFKNIFFCFYYHYATILYYGLYKNNYFNMDISRSSFSGIPPFHQKEKVHFYIKDDLNSTSNDI